MTYSEYKNTGTNYGTLSPTCAASSVIDYSRQADSTNVLMKS